MANETTSLFGSLPESQTNDGKIILHTDNGAERSSVALSELVGGGSCIADGGTLTDNSTIDVPNNASSTLTSEQETLTLNVNVDEGEVPNFAVEILAETNIELTVTKTVGEGTPVTLYASSIGGSSLVSGKYYQISCIGNCWTLAEFITASPTPIPPNPNPLNLPSNTIRVKFKSGYTPEMGDSQTLVDANENIWDITKNGSSWSGLFNGDIEDSDAVIEVLGANATGITSMANMFTCQSSLTSIAYFDTSSVTNMSFFADHTAITTIPPFNLNNVNDMDNAFISCTALTEIPDFVCDDITEECNVGNAFANCINVNTGILNMYNKLKHIEPWADSHYNSYYYECTFENCGSNSQSGAAELAQIPNCWKTPT